MKNLSIRTRILAALVLVNFLGAMVVVVYLHESFSTGFDVTAEKMVAVSAGAWGDIATHVGTPIDPPLLVNEGAGFVDRMNKMTGANYGLMVDKASITAEEYAKLRTAANLPDNYSEGETYVLVAATDEALAEKMQFGAKPDSVPEGGKIVGIENGACTQTCHGNLRAPGDYWGVEWSTDGRTRAHAVFPVADSSGKPVGLVYALDDMTRQVDAAEKSLFQTMAVILGTLLVSTLFIGWALDVLVLRRLQKMAAAIEDLSVRVAGGDFDARFAPDGTTDEIGAFEQFFANFVDVMTSTIKSLTKR